MSYPDKYRNGRAADGSGETWIEVVAVLGMLSAILAIAYSVWRFFFR